MSSLKEKLLKKAIPDTEWLAEAQWRQDNEAWLDISFKIAVKIASTLKQKNITQKELAEKMACSPHFVSTLLKGSENLTLETICKLEKALEIKLISIVSTKTTVIDMITLPILSLTKSQKYAHQNHEYEPQALIDNLEELKMTA
jgi:transcriptional regulator with XRE-family HTH domain